MVVYKFTKNNCPGCKSLGKTLESISIDGVEIQEKSVEFDENKILARSYGLSSVPALVRVSDNKTLIGGSHKSEQILAFLKGE